MFCSTTVQRETLNCGEHYFGLMSTIIGARGLVDSVFRSAVNSASSSTVGAYAIAS